MEDPKDAMKSLIDMIPIAIVYDASKDELPGIFEKLDSNEKLEDSEMATVTVLLLKVSEKLMLQQEMHIEDSSNEGLSDMNIDDFMDQPTED